MKCKKYHWYIKIGYSEDLVAEGHVPTVEQLRWALLELVEYADPSEISVEITRSPPKALLRSLSS